MGVRVPPFAPVLAVVVPRCARDFGCGLPLAAFGGSFTPAKRLQFESALSRQPVQSPATPSDDLARLGSVTCVNGTTNVWNQNFGYGALGNITKAVPTGGTGPSFQVSYNIPPTQRKARWVGHPRVRFAGYTYAVNGGKVGRPPKTGVKPSQTGCYCRSKSPEGR